MTRPSPAAGGRLCSRPLAPGLRDGALLIWETPASSGPPSGLLRAPAEGFRRRGCGSAQQRRAGLTPPAPPAAPDTSPRGSSVLLFPARPRTVPGARRCPWVSAVQAARDGGEDSIGKQRTRADGVRTQNGLTDARPPSVPARPPRAGAAAHRPSPGFALALASSSSVPTPTGPQARRAVAQS